MLPQLPGGLLHTGPCSVWTHGTLQPLRPFHCQLGPTKPTCPADPPQRAQPCLSWYLFLEGGEARRSGDGSEWGVLGCWQPADPSPAFPECSRPVAVVSSSVVFCPEPGLCGVALRPNSTRSCNTHPCTQWVVGPWGQVSKCGGSGGERACGQEALCQQASITPFT